MSELEIFISGDFCPIKNTKELSNDISHPKEVLGQLHKVINESDISITNLEGPITKKENPINKTGSNFKISPKVTSFLSECGFDIVTLANNHIYDQGQKGIKDTFKNLETKNIDWMGAGKNLAEAQKPYYYEVNGIDLAFVNFADVEFSCANENHGGANPMDIIENFNQIKDAKEKADYVITIIHGGHEHYHYPSPETRKRYRFLAENGADVIVSHHPHCIVGYEVYKEVPIFYSLGNFLFPPYDESKSYSESWFEGYSIILKLKENDLDFEIFSYEQCKTGELKIDYKAEESEIHNKIKKLSADLKNEELIHSKWNEYVENKKRFLGYMNGFNRSMIDVLIKIGLLEKLLNKNKLNMIKQFITSLAHRETARELLKKYLKY